MYIFRGIDPEVNYPRSIFTLHTMISIVLLLQEPVISSGHLCHFQDMQVKSVLLDEIMKEPESPAVELVMDLDIKVSEILREFSSIDFHFLVLWSMQSLRDTRDLLNKVGLRDAQRFIEDNPHPRLWWVDILQEHYPSIITPALLGDYWLSQLY